MEAVLIALIQQLNGAVFVLICLLVLGFWGAYKIGGIKTYFSETKDKNEKIDGKVDGIKDVLAKVKATTDLLYQSHLSTVQKHSPITLTPLGDEIAKETSLDEKLNEHWDAIIATVNKEDPKNPYDLQTIAMELARNCFDTLFTQTEQNEIKTLAYKKGLNLLEIYPIIGVKIRDRVLKEMGLGTDEIDKHDPTKLFPKK